MRYTLPVLALMTGTAALVGSLMGGYWAIHNIKYQDPDRIVVLPSPNTDILECRLPD